MLNFEKFILDFIMYVRNDIYEKVCPEKNKEMELLAEKNILKKELKEFEDIKNSKKIKKGEQFKIVFDCIEQVIDLEKLDKLIENRKKRIRELEKNKYFVGVDLANEEKLIEMGIRPAVGQIEKVTGELLKEINTQEKQKVYTRDGESGVTVEKPIPDTPQEINKQSVDEIERIAKDERPIPQKGVSTTESVVGKSPVDIFNETKEELVKAVAKKVNYPKIKK